MPEFGKPARQQASLNGPANYVKELKLRSQIFKEMLEKNRADNIVCEAAIQFLPKERLNF